MQIQFCGANHEVTGSCHLLRTKKYTVLVDCGMFQGGNYTMGKNFDPFPFDPKEVDVLLLTHAHLDHVGRIPKLIKEGFTGKIFATKGTVPLAKIVMEDAQRIMQYNNKKFQYPILYSEDDVAAAVSLFEGIDYRTSIEVLPGMKVVWKDAGHILGSAFLEVEVDGARIGFSGDIGNEDVPILKDTEPLGQVDVLLTESTYGDRFHESRDDAKHTIVDLIGACCAKKGTIMVPAFSIERTQELLHELDHLEADGKLLAKMPIFLDSPMAISVTDVFRDFPDYYDQEAASHVKRGDDFLDFPQLELTYSKEESKKINERRPPKMVIAGAGMMNGGRILHHAHRYLPDPNSTLILVGYQAQGSLGRRLYEGAETVKIFGDTIPVRATVKAIGGMSAHGDQTKLLNWIGSAPTPPQKIYCVHGEPTAATELAHRAKDKFGTQAYVPEFADVVDL